MADERINGLDPVAAFDTYNFIVDKDGDSSASRLPGSVLDAELQALSDAISANTDLINTNTSAILDHEDRLQVFENEITYTQCTNVSTRLTASANCFVEKSGHDLYIDGQIQAGSTIAEDEVVFTLPTNFPTFRRSVKFNAAGANPNENYELKTVGGTRNIVGGAGQSTDGTANFNVTVLATKS